MRHDDLKVEFIFLCAQAFRPSNVRGEPLINNNRDRAGDDQLVEHNKELRGDIAVHGLWNPGRTAIFDVRVSDTYAKSYSGKDPKKVMANIEQLKRAKYGEACCQQ